MKFLPTATVLDERYQIVSVLGKGGSGTVYKAKDLESNQIVAVKVLTTNEFDPRAALQRQFFQREVELLKRVSHPNIIHILDSGISPEGQLYLVTDYVAGNSLKSIMKTGQLTLDRISNIFNQVAEALQAIHNQGIIHRDFKPQNILVTEFEDKEIAKLLDFGIAKMIRGSDQEAFLRTITSKGVITGTTQYMSPEQCQGAKLDERSDIYSMGITAYELFSGRVPFDNASTLGIILMHVEVAPPAIEGLPKPIEEVIMKALEKFPENRFACATDFANALVNAIAETKRLANQVVILGNGAKADEETEAFSPEFSEAPTQRHKL